MNKLFFLFRISVLFTLFLSAACGTIPGSMENGHYIINVTGTPMALNCSKTYYSAGHYDYEENDEVSLAVSAGDLIYFQLMEDEILCYRYQSSDGLDLSLRYDTIYQRFYLNDELISVRLSEGSSAWDWLAGADKRVLSGIRSFHISLPLSEDEIKSLDMLSGVISHPGLYMEGDSMPAEVLTLLKPCWLIAEDLQYSTITEDVKAGLKHLELLWYSGEDFIDQDFLSGLPELNSLIIENWDSTDITDFQFEKLHNLRSLSIIECDIHDLSPIVSAAGIKDLNLIFCESLKDIGAAAELPGMTCLGLTGCEDIIDIPAIIQMPQLTRLSLPGNTSQAEFMDILTSLSNVQVLELIGCNSITDLSPLENYSGLKALTLDLDVPDVHPVCQLKGLELLVLKEDFFNDSLAISEIRHALPDTRIVAGGGFCLGSGWILLLIPAIIILIILKTRLYGSSIAKAR